MDIVKRLLAVFLVVTALAAAVLLIATPLYHDGSPEYPHWKIMNWFMAFAVPVALIVSYLRKRALGDDPDVSEYVRVGATYYAAIVLTMLFFWEWFWTLNPESETGLAATSHMVYFPIMDALFVVVCLATGRYLWSRASEG